MRTMLGLALLCLLVLPTAAAHATVKSDDGQWWITVGHRNEPTSTWQRSGLDLIVRAVGTDDAGQEIRVEHDKALHLDDSVAVTIIAPDGREMDCPLEEQEDRANEHGVTNRYTCADPYILSRSGQYQARITGDIDGSPVDGVYNISGELDNFYATVFPSARELDPAELQARIDALEARVAELESRENHSTGGVQNGIPGMPVMLVAAAMLAFAAFRRRV